MDSSAAITNSTRSMPPTPGQHVLDEALVAGHVDEAQPQRGRQLEVREAEVDGDAAALLFFQAVGIDAGQRFDQRGLAVIDVAGGADDDVLHAACYSVKVLALPLLALVAGSLVYCVLTIVAAIRYRAVRAAAAPGRGSPISVLKPLAGVDEGLEENLRSFFEQQYPGVRNSLRGAQSGRPGDRAWWSNCARATRGFRRGSS